MAAAAPAALALAAVKTIGGYEDAQAQIGAARADRAAGYVTANANEERVRARSAQQLGEQRAAAAESGFDPNTGSLALVQEQSAGNAELDALTERYKGQLNAWKDSQQIKNAQASIRGGAVTLAAGAALAGGAQFGSDLTSLMQGSSYW